MRNVDAIICVEHLVKANRKMKLELSANRSGIFNECRSVTQHKFSCHAYEKMIQWIIFECRALREDDPKEKSELSTNDTCALNENKQAK